MKSVLLNKEIWRNRKLNPLNLILSLALLALLIELLYRPLELTNSFTTLLNISENFFVRCTQKFNCTSFLLPFLGYVLRSFDSLEKMFILWVLTSASLTAYLSYEILTGKAEAIKKIVSILLWLSTSLLLKFDVLNVESIPCMNCLLISLLKMNLNKDRWQSFAFTALLLNFGMGIIFYLFLITLLLSKSFSKKTRLITITIVRQIYLGFGIIVTYLLMIEYNFL